MYRFIFAVVFAVFSLSTLVNAQKAEVAVSLNEAFFDALLDSIYQNFDAPEFSLARNNIHRRDVDTPVVRTGSGSGWVSTRSVRTQSLSLPVLTFASQRLSGEKSACTESVKILREINGVRTAFRFREGKIYVPLAFSGNYAPPFVGCVEFSGWAESNIDLDFDRNGQRLIGRVRVLNVNLSGTGGVGGSVIAKLLQTSIDKKFNPIDILTLDKLSFLFPISKSGSLKIKATAIRTEIGNGVLNVVVTYQFLKS